MLPSIMAHGKLLRLGSSGFTIIGTLISAGMMGGLSLLLADLTRKQLVLQMSAETDLEITALYSRMTRTLYNGQACNQTLNVGQTVQQGDTINAIKNSDNESIFINGSEYGKGLVRIESMELGTPQITGNSGEVDIVVTLVKQSKAIKSKKKVIRRLPLNLEVSSGTTPNLINCHFSGEDIPQIISDVVVVDVDPLLDGEVVLGKESMCTMMGGTYDANVDPPCVFSGSLDDAWEPETNPTGPDVDIPRHFTSPPDYPDDTNFCDLPEYICLRNAAVSATRDCGIKAGSAPPSYTVSHTNACFTRSPNFPPATADSTVSCDDAKARAGRAADRYDFATRLSLLNPQGYMQGRIYCDDACSPDGPTTYTARCFVYPRGKVYKCTYRCLP